MPRKVSVLLFLNLFEWFNSEVNSMLCITLKCMNLYFDNYLKKYNKLGQPASQVLRCKVQRNFWMTFPIKHFEECFN